MINNDANINNLKHRVVISVCKAAWEGEVDDAAREKIVYAISPGPKPEYRCCVYKEREIVRGRIRLACNENADVLNPTTNVVQVIEPACDECPIAAYTVTDNCRFCLGRPCISSCKFNAITPGDIRMHINSKMCKECGKCAEACPFGSIVHLQRPCKKACPVNAISYDEYGFCKIDEEKCIHCGQCVHNCPFGAISTKVALVPIIRAIQEGKEVIAMCAPASEGQFGAGIGMASLKAALKEIGFADMVEVGLGGDMTAAYEAKEWIEAKKEGKKMTTSCCPAFISMIRHNFPKVYAENKSTTVSPMVAISRYLKATRPGCITVFVGPCIAKKGECLNEYIADRPDYAITFGELTDLFASRNITPKPVEEDYQESSTWGKKFASSGGVAKAVIEVMEEMGEDTSGIKLLSCAGGADCKKALMMLNVGRLQEDFVEGMMCPGGCVGGPSKLAAEKEITKARAGLIAKADGRKILENLKNYPMDKFSMYRDGHMEE